MDFVQLKYNTIYYIFENNLAIYFWGFPLSVFLDSVEGFPKKKSILVLLLPAYLPSY